MDFPIGQVFRVPPANEDDDPRSSIPNLREVTKGIHTRGIDVQKGMFFFEAVDGPDGVVRRPAFVFDSNNLDKKPDSNPWLDVIDADEGFALYHGDNRQPGRMPLESRGNHAIADVLRQYAEPGLRALAPPVLVFEHVQIGSRRKGHRRFAGFGVPTALRLQAQGSRSGHFINLAIELALFGLEAENGLFPWSWIDARRDNRLSAAEANRQAPRAWREWVRDGDTAIGRIRRSVIRSRVVREVNQRPTGERAKKIVAEVRRYYADHPHGFEGLASWVTQRVLGDRCARGWVTKRSGDGGIDFVNRLDVARGLSDLQLVVLGQAKLRPEETGISGADLARVVARLRRGWVGVFVTTGVYSSKAQSEVFADNYPLLLINGSTLADELLIELATTGATLQQVLDRESAWYDAHMTNLEPEQINGSARSGVSIWPVSELHV